jgi:chromosome partitioning protein
MITAIANQKGGVAKTTSTIALGGLLAEEGSCLVVDLDPQGNLTTGLDITLEPGQPTVYDVLLGKASVKEAIVETPFNLSVIPAASPLAEAEKELLATEETRHYYILRDKLKSLRRSFEHILIDCPPSMSLLTTNALCAAEYLIIPVQCQYFAVRGLEEVLKTINAVRREFNANLEILGVLPTMAETNTLMTQNVLKTLRDQLGDIRVFDPIPKSVKFPESNLAGEPIHIYSGEWKLVQPYRDVMRELLLLLDE